MLLASQMYGQDATIDKLQTALKTTSEIEERVSLLTDIGVAYFNGQVYFDSAFYYVEKAHLLAAENALENAEARPLFNLGIIQNFLNNHDEAIDYYVRAKNILEKYGRSSQVGAAYNNIGGTYFEQKKYDKALENYELALAIALEANDSLNMGIDYMNIGEVYYSTGRLEKSKETFEMSLELLRSANYNPPTVHLFYARTLFALDEFDVAENEAILALDISKADKDLYYSSETAMLLANIYSEKNDFEKAFQYQQEAKVKQDSLNTAKELNEVEKLNLNFELQKNKEELAFIRQKNQYQNIIYALAGLGLLLLGILISRQIKLVKINQEMRDVQKRLIEGELNQREMEHKVRHATGFEASKSQDNEL
jgi:hypothetical protein